MSGTVTHKETGQPIAGALVGAGGAETVTTDKDGHYVLANVAAGLVVEGHTDSQNTDEFNQKLSEDRAKAVVAWLVKNGIAPGRLQPVGYGESRPVADNDTAEGRALNRRVEVQAMGEMK